MAANWLMELLEWCVQHGREDAENWVQWTQGRSQSKDRDEVAQRVVFQQAKLAAHAAVTPAAVSSIPGVRTAISAGKITVEVGFLVYRAVKSILYQAAVYGHDLKGRDLPDRILLVLGVAFGEEKTREALVNAGRVSPNKVLAQIAGSSEAYAALLAEKISARFAGRGLVSELALGGRFYFGAQNFMFISAATLAGRYVFNDLVLTKDELKELDQKMLEKSRTMLGLMVWMANADGKFEGTEKEMIERVVGALVMPGIHRDDMHQEISAKPDWDRVRKVFNTEDEKAGLIENILMVVWADGEKQPEEDRLCRRLSAELVADRMFDEIEMAVRQH